MVRYGAELPAIMQASLWATPCSARVLHAASHCPPQCSSADRRSTGAILTGSGPAVSIAGELVHRASLPPGAAAQHGRPRAALAMINAERKHHVEAPW